LSKNTHSPFRFKQFSIGQSEGVFKVGTDACLLAVLSPISGAKRILDVGTGTGLIALMLAQRCHDAAIVAIDINPKAADLAQENFNSSPWRDGLSAMHVELKSFASSNPGGFDHIVCNPPFFKDSLINQKTTTAQARHEVDLSLTELVSSSRRLLSHNGKFTFILPYQRRQEIEAELMAQSLHILKRIDIKPFANAESNRVIYTVSKTMSTLSAEPLIIYDDQNQFTPTILTLFKPYYLRL